MKAIKTEAYAFISARWMKVSISRTTSESVMLESNSESEIDFDKDKERK